MNFKHGQRTTADIVVRGYVGRTTRLSLGRILRKAERYSRSGRLVKSLDISIEIGCKSVNQFDSETAFEGCRGRAVIAYAANNLDLTDILDQADRDYWIGA
jgi:hypothetical protein